MCTRRGACSSPAGVRHGHVQTCAAPHPPARETSFLPAQLHSSRGLSSSPLPLPPTQNPGLSAFAQVQGGVSPTEQGPTVMPRFTWNLGRGHHEAIVTRCRGQVCAARLLTLSSVSSITLKGKEERAGNEDPESQNETSCIQPDKMEVCK